MLTNATVNRRRFIAAAATAAAGAALPWSLPSMAGEAPKKRALKKAIMYGTIGIEGSVLDKFKALKAAGFHGVEPNSHMDVEEVLRARDATGLELPSVCCSTHWAKPLSDPNPNVRKEGLDGLIHSLKDAKSYGSTSVLLVPGVVNDKVKYEEAWERCIAEIRKAIPVAEETGVKIAIENVWNNFITKPEQAVALMDAINSPHVGWHFDIGNVIRYSPPETWIPHLGKRILKLHLKEFSKVKGFGVGFFEGDNNWPAIMAALDQVGYTGWGITEQPGEQTKAAVVKDFVEKIDKIYAIS